ncbi:MFS transporter [Dyella humicola]|uniref:MFS transporter n=1 Tax=Dyella humicola TaxID=2992126 RepID=UPI002253A537|nr:MFS transporter [Dyella humicola]
MNWPRPQQHGQLTNIRPDTASHLLERLFPWAIGLCVGMDYFDNAMFSFFASDIAGGVNASPDELVWAASTYAVAAVLGILQQQWWVERLGFRRYLIGCVLLFAVASAACTLCESSLELSLVRGAQGYLMGPMLSACRILIQMSFTPQERPRAVRTFLSMILLGSALAPLAGGYLVGNFGWRSLFACTSIVSFGIAAFALVAIPAIGKRPTEERGESHFWPYIVFALAIGALQIAMQQVRFEIFSTSPDLIILTALGLVAIGWFARHQWQHPRPLVQLKVLKERMLLTGIVMYIFYYYISSALGFLLSRLLEVGLGYPVENTGRLVGLAAMASLPMCFIYFKYSARVARKKWIIIPGYSIAFVLCLWITRMPPNVSASWLIPPLLMRAGLLLTMDLPVANATFSVFAINSFNHGYRFKNIVKQLTYSFATATTIILQQHRNALHHSRLAEQVNPYNPAYQSTMDTLTRSLVALGHSPVEANGLALAKVSQDVSSQAAFLSAQDGFAFLGIIALCGIGFGIWQRQIR